MLRRGRGGGARGRRPRRASSRSSSCTSGDGRRAGRRCCSRSRRRRCWPPASTRSRSARPSACWRCWRRSATGRGCSSRPRSRPRSRARSRSRSWSSRSAACCSAAAGRARCAARSVAIPLCAILLMLAAEVAIYQAFPGGGPFPYPAADLIGITAFALCGLAARARIAADAPARRALPRVPRDRVVGQAVPVAARRQRDARARLRRRAAARARDRGARSAGARARRARAHRRDRLAGGAVRPERRQLVRRAGAGGLVLAAGDLVPAPAGPPRSRQLPRRGRLHGAPLRVVLPHARRGRGDPARLVPAERLPVQRRALRPHAERRRVPALAAPDGRPLRLPARPRRARPVREGRGRAAAQRAQRAARDPDLEGLPRLRAARRHAAPDARRRAPGRDRARGRRARAARDARAVLALAAAGRAPTSCASTTRPTGASTTRRRPASSPARTG